MGRLALRALVVSAASQNGCTQSVFLFVEEKISELITCLDGEATSVSVEVRQSKTQSGYQLGVRSSGL